MANKAISLEQMSRIWGKVKSYVASAISGLYTKPSGGIPKSDLSTEVQTSLGKADTALQSFTESDPTVPAWAKQPSKPTYTAQEVGALPSSTPIPTKISDLDNDSGFLTQHQDISGKQDVIDDLQTIRSGAAKGETALQSFTETDPTVPSWAKQPSKPSYTASEVGALPDTTKYAGSQSAGGAANKAVSIPTGQVDSTSTATEFTATVDGITELRDGVCVWLRNGVVDSTTGCTININNLGAKPICLSNTESTRVAYNFYKMYTCLFIYNTSRVSGGCWDYVVGFDSNTDTNAYNIRRNRGNYLAKTALYSGVIVFTYSDTELLPVNSANRNSGTSKTLTTESFDPFGAIFFYAGTNVAQGGAVSSSYNWLQYAGDLRYSFNTGSTLTSNKNVYLVCTPQSDGRVKLADTPISQDLPTTEDGKVYIYLGVAYDGANLELHYNHPIYYFKDGAIRQWTNSREDIVQASLSKRGVVSQTQTWTYDYSSYTISDKQYGLIPKEFVDRWLVLVGEYGTFNETTGYFGLNGLTDISYNEALDIVKRYNPTGGNEGWRANSLGLTSHFTARTSIPFVSVGSTTPYLTWNIWIEESRFALTGNNVSIELTNFVSYGCYRLRKMWDVYAISNADVTLSYFYALEECCFKLGKNFSATSSKNLSLASIVYMVENATNTTAVTYTLHATAYARCQADTTEYTYNGQTYTGVIAYAAAKNITIQSA